ncbi:MAG: hypothetical protein FJX67_11345 [Alphaproteobacteria bacterium]|nr:hypothetical protein [Alphaproteobacteria bacterium]
MDQTKDKIPLIIYILYLLGFIVGITPLIGLVMAYVYRGDAASWQASHYTHLIRTFWIGLLVGAVGALLAIVLIGWIILVILAIWYVVRCIKGIKLASQEQPYPKTTAWGF